MSFFQSTLYCYGLIFSEDLTKLWDEAARTMQNAQRPLDRQSNIFMVGRTSQFRDIPPSLEKVLLGAGIAWEWHVMGAERREARWGIYFDPLSGEQVHFQHDAGTPPLPSSTSENPAERERLTTILARMCPSDSIYPLLHAESRHQALKQLTDPRLPEGLAEQCLTRRSQQQHLAEMLDLSAA